MSATVTHIYRYPVKSMGGHILQDAQLNALGIPGDRCWTLKDEERGGIKGGKRFPELMSMQATLQAEPSADNPSPEALIELSDGSCVSSLDNDVNARLSAAVGAPVTLWPLLPADQLAHYRRLPPEPGADMEASLRAVFARTADEPLPDLSAFPAELMTYESPPGTYFDAYPLLVVSNSSLASMAASNSQSTDQPAANFDLRRFRPNILVDTAETGFPENEWVGRQAAVGDAVLSFEIACPRCIMTTHGFAELPKDPRIMRALVKYNQGNLGVYANVVENGRVQPGDTLRWL